MHWDVLPYPCEKFLILVLNEKILVRYPPRMCCDLDRSLPARQTPDEFFDISHAFSRLLVVDLFPLHYYGFRPRYDHFREKIRPSLNRF